MTEYFDALIKAIEQRREEVHRECAGGGRRFVPIGFNDVLAAIKTFGVTQSCPTTPDFLCPCTNVHTSRMWDGIVVPDFKDNVEKWMGNCSKAVGTELASKNANFVSIQRWFESLLPVHLCNKAAFINILSVRGMGSLDGINRLWKDPRESLLFLLNTEGVKRAIKSIEKDRYEFSLRRLVRWEFRAYQAKVSQRLVKKQPNKQTSICCMPAHFLTSHFFFSSFNLLVKFDNTVQSVMAGIPADTLSLALNSFRMVPPLQLHEKEKYESVLAQAVDKFGDAAIARLRESVADGGRLISEMLMNTPGIGFSADKETQCNKQIFGILGPNMGTYGNREVAIVFKRASMEHPDFFMTPFAAMGYYQGWYTKNTRVGIDRPWGGEAKPWDYGGRVDYQKGMFQAMTPNWGRGCAMEWIARVAHSKGVNPNTVTLRDVQMLIHDSDPHTAVEAHLPEYAPVEHIKKVYVKRGLFNPEELKAIQERVIAVEADDPAEAVFAEMCRPRGDNEKTDFTGYRLSLEPWSGECVVPVALPSHGSSAEFVCFQKEIDVWIGLREGPPVRPKEEGEAGPLQLERTGIKSKTTAAAAAATGSAETCVHITERGPLWYKFGIKEGMKAERKFPEMKKSQGPRFTSGGTKYRVLIDPATKTVAVEYWEVWGNVPDAKLGNQNTFERDIGFSPMFLSVATSTIRANVNKIHKQLAQLTLMITFFFLCTS